MYTDLWSLTLYCCCRRSFQRPRIPYLVWTREPCLHERACTRALPVSLFRWASIEVCMVRIPFESAAHNSVAASPTGANSKHVAWRRTAVRQYCLLSLTLPGCTALFARYFFRLYGTTCFATGVQGDPAREKGDLHHSGGHLPDRRHLSHGVLLRGAGGELYVRATAAVDTYLASARSLQYQDFTVF